MVPGGEGLDRVQVVAEDGLEVFYELIFKCLIKCFNFDNTNCKLL